MPRRISWAMVAALLLAAVFVAATLSVMDYPLGVAWDEFVKLRAISTGRDRFYHPLVMIDLAQAAALVVQPPDWQSLAQLARILAGLAGGLLIFGAFSLARLVLPDLPALAAAAATAVTPLVTVHARIFKEDTFVAAFPRLDACRANQIATMPGAEPSCWASLLDLRQVRNISACSSCRSLSLLSCWFPRPGQNGGSCGPRPETIISRRRTRLRSRWRGYYRGLNALPHLEVSSGRPTMGYFNPALRVVALDGSVERLKTLAEQIRAAAPTFTVRLIEQANTK